MYHNTKKYMDAILGELTVGDVINPDRLGDLLKVIDKQIGQALNDGHEMGNSQVHHKKRIKVLRDGILVHTYDSIADAAKELGIDKSPISAIALKKSHRKSYKGYTFEFEDQNNKFIVKNDRPEAENIMRSNLVFRSAS